MVLVETPDNEKAPRQGLHEVSSLDRGRSGPWLPRRIGHVCSYIEDDKR